jgi:hypothetical protein
MYNWFHRQLLDIIVYSTSDTDVDGIISLHLHVHPTISIVQSQASFSSLHQIDARNCLACQQAKASGVYRNQQFSVDLQLRTPSQVRLVNVWGLYSSLKPWM